MQVYQNGWKRDKIPYRTGMPVETGRRRLCGVLSYARSVFCRRGNKKHEEPLREGCSGRTQLHWKGFSDIKYYYREI